MTGYVILTIILTIIVTIILTIIQNGHVTEKL